MRLRTLVKELLDSVEVYDIKDSDCFSGRFTAVDADALEALRAHQHQHIIVKCCTQFNAQRSIHSIELLAGEYGSIVRFTPYYSRGSKPKPVDTPYPNIDSGLRAYNDLVAAWGGQP